MSLWGFGTGLATVLDYNGREKTLIPSCNNRSDEEEVVIFFSIFPEPNLPWIHRTTSWKKLTVESYVRKWSDDEFVQISEISGAVWVHNWAGRLTRAADISEFEKINDVDQLWCHEPVMCFLFPGGGRGWQQEDRLSSGPQTVSGNTSVINQVIDRLTGSWSLVAIDPTLLVYVFQHREWRQTPETLEEMQLQRESQTGETLLIHQLISNCVFIQVFPQRWKFDFLQVYFVENINAGSTDGDETLRQVMTHLPRGYLTQSLSLQKADSWF